MIRKINSFFIAIDKAVTYKVRDGKEYLIRKAIEICRAYSKEVIGITPSKNTQLNISRSLSLLPAMILALIKSVSKCIFFFLLFIH